MRQITILMMNFAAVLLGLTAGAMLLIGTALIPYWASLRPPAYRSSFAAMDLGRTMLVLGGASFVVSAAAFALIMRQPGATRRFVAVSAVCWAIPTLAYPFVFEPLNLQIASNAPLTSDQILNLLDRWQVLHWLRIALGLIAFVSMLAALNRGIGPRPGPEDRELHR
jgi:hypothetical protein